MITRLFHRQHCLAFLLVVFGPLSVQVAAAAQPSLAFSDLTSGPDEGLGDGLGSGVIVTVWGQHLNGARERVVFEDSAGESHTPYIYYWKQADGKSPSGPANLHESHRMYEVAFSIPESESGEGSIYLEVDGDRTNALPFTVRPGEIVHVKADGDNGNSGTWNSPKASVNEALNNSPAGSTIYVHDVDTGGSNSPVGLFWRNTSASGGVDNQLTVTSYPGYHPKVMGQRGFEAYKTEGAVLSKMDIYSSDYTSVSDTGQPQGERIDPRGTWGIKANKNGRAVANRVGDIPGMCASRYQGAIVGSGGDRVSNFRILGNEVYDYGCEGSTKLHHTTYMAIRSGPYNVQVEPWEFGYNYLHGNKAKFGIHNFDQDEGCGGTTGPVWIHNNVVKDQGGAGISIGASAGCKWDMDFHVENNILINVGLAAAWNGIDPDSSDGSEPGGIAIRDSGLMGTVYVRNNLVYGWSVDGLTRGANGCLAFNGGGDNVTVVWENNVCFTNMDVPFFATGFRAENKADNAIGQNNVWHYSGNGADSDKAKVPSWASSSITRDPMIRVDSSIVYLEEGSPLVDTAMPVARFSDGVYGVSRGSQPDIGPIEFAGVPPKAPSDIRVD